MLPLPRVCAFISRAVCGVWISDGVTGRLPLIVDALDGLLDPLKYPGAFSRLDCSAGLITLYRCALATRASDVVKGELGLEGGLLTFSGMAVGKPSNCLEYRLLV